MRYTVMPEYTALVAAVHTTPNEDAARLALADWVQEHGDEAEALAIRCRLSVDVDVLPAIRSAAQSAASATARVVNMMGDLYPATTHELKQAVTALQECVECLTIVLHQGQLQDGSASDQIS